MNPYKILVIDDNKMVLRTLNLVLKGVFSSVITVTDPKLIPALLKDGDVDIVLLDMNFDGRKLDGEEGLFWLHRIAEMPQPPAVVLITAFADVSLAVRGLMEGADDFVTKPWSNQQLIERLESAIENHRNKQRTVSLAAEAATLLEQMKASSQLSLDELEKKHILEIVEQEHGNLVNAADRLGISRQTLYNKLKKFGTHL